MDDCIRYIGEAELATAQEAPRPEEQTVLDTVNARIAAGQSLQEILQFLFTATRDLSPCDRTALAFIEEGGARAVANCVVADYQPLRLERGYWQDLSQSSLRAVLDVGTPRIICDLPRYLADHPDSPSARLLVDEGVRSSMTCPLRVDDRIVGFLFRSSRSANAFAAHQVMLHLRIAERLSQAVEKAYRIERLAAANAAYMEMLTFVTHELKSPLASIIMDGIVLTDGYLGALQPRQLDKLQKIVAKAQFLTGLIQDYLNLARLEGGGLQPRVRPAVHVRHLVAASLELLAAQIEESESEVTCHFPAEGPTVDCDPELMQIVFANLIGNAVKYGNQKGEVRVKLSQTDDKVIGSVWNSGPGFPDSERPRLFRRFSRIKTPELMARKGSGVGLYTVWQIINCHGGRVWADSKLGEWAEFSFEIPLRQHPDAANKAQ